MSADYEKLRMAFSFGSAGSAPGFGSGAQSQNAQLGPELPEIQTQVRLKDNVHMRLFHTRVAANGISRKWGFSQ